MTSNILPFRIVKKSGSSHRRFNPNVKLCIEIASNGLRLQTFDYFEEFPILNELYLTKTKTRALKVIQDIIYGLGLEEFFVASIRKKPLKKKVINNVSYMEVELLCGGYMLYTYDSEGTLKHRAELCLKGVKKQEKELLEKLLKSLGLHNFIIIKTPKPTLNMLK